MAGLHSKRVLVIDDHPDAAELLAWIIKEACPGIETKFETGARKGFDMACAWRPDVVITDIDMPMLTGIEAALELRGLWDEQPLWIIALTGNPQWLKDAMASAVFDLTLLKPPNIRLLLQYLEDRLRARSRVDA